MVVARDTVYAYTLRRRKAMLSLVYLSVLAKLLKMLFKK